MTKERTKEDWEHEGWIVGDGSIVGKDRAGVYDVYDIDRDAFVDLGVEMLSGFSFQCGFAHKLVRPLPKLPEPGCAEKYQAKRQTTWEEYNAAHDAANAKLAAKACQNDADLQIEPVPGKWYVVRHLGVIDYAEYYNTPYGRPEWRLPEEEQGAITSEDIEILAEAPSPEELLK